VCTTTALEHALVTLRRPDEVPQVGPGAALVLSGIPFRTCWKTAKRGWRHLWWDARTILANLLARAAAHGVAARVQAGFADDTVAELVGIDGVEELPLVVVELGEAHLVMPPAGSLDPLLIPSPPVALRVLRFPLADEAHAAGVLIDEAVAAWREGARAVSRSAPTQVDALAGTEQAQRIEDVILQRGSTRVFRAGRASTELLEWALAAAARAVPLDAAPADTLIELLVNVHDVEGVEPGGYRYTSDGASRPKSASPIPAPQEPACAWASPSAATPPTPPSTPSSCPRCLAPWGQRLPGRAPRSRHRRGPLSAQRLRAGGWRHRAHLLRRAGVALLNAAKASPLLATAIGHARPPTPPPSVTPGRPAQLRGYGNVMNRLASRLTN